MHTTTPTPTDSRLRRVRALRVAASRLAVARARELGDPARYHAAVGALERANALYTPTQCAAARLAYLRAAGRQA